MYEISEEALRDSLKPFDVVSTREGGVGFISETSLNRGQPSHKRQVSYAVTWMIQPVHHKVAWWLTEDLTYHCNLMVLISQNMCNQFGSGGRDVPLLFNNFKVR